MLFDPIGMTSASMSMRGAGQRQELGAAAQRRPPAAEVHRTYYRVPAAGGVNSNIKDMALWMLAQMGEMPDVLSPQLLEHDPRAAGQDAGRARAHAQVPRAARRRLLRLWLAQL